MLPKALKILRTNRKMSQKELADIIGVSQQTIGSWEVGRTSPDPDMINKLARFFNVTTDYLLGNDVPPAAAIPHNNQKLLDTLHQIAGNKDWQFILDASGELSDDDVSRLAEDVKRAIVYNQSLKHQDRPKPSTDTATLIGRKILTASTDAQLAVNTIIEQDKKK